jgi:CheY-like chemotaxis protein
MRPARDTAAAVNSQEGDRTGGSSVLLFPSRPPPARRGQPSAGDEASGTGLLGGWTVLLVEDDFIVGFDMQTLLEEEGANVIGPAATLAEAKDLLARSTPSVAVLDVNLNGEFVFPLVDDLRRRAIPFVFATAYSDDERLFPEEVRSAPRLAKPVLPNVLIGQLTKLLR